MAGFGVAALGESAFRGVGTPAATGISGRPASARKRSRSLARVSVSPKVVVMPRICSSGLRRARATAKASSMSSPMSVSMITFSEEVFSGRQDWAAIGPSKPAKQSRVLKPQ